jgi:CheY-like chemotaxis protein
VFRVQLELLGYRVVEATDGQEAVELERSELPELILMDLMMPRLNGLEATRLIRQKTNNAALIIIACTCLNDPETKRRAFAAGCNDYMQKPFAMADLPLLLHRYLPV